MSSYIGVRCPVCNKKFTEADDIVVCPICGAPHHRDCYAQTNQCAFVADHLSGKEWRDPNAQTTPPPGGAETKACPRCGAMNPGDSIFCQVCGNLMTLAPPNEPAQPGAQPGHPHAEWTFGGYGMRVDPISMAYGGLNPDDEIDGESVQDLAQYIGSGSGYYLPRFRLMSEYGRSLMPNLSAFIFNFFFYFYRKMYLIGSILLGLYIVSIIPSFLYTWEILPQVLHDMGLGPDVQINQAAADHFFRIGTITRTINFFIGVVFSLCANRFYYAKVLGAVHNIRTEAQDKDPSASYSVTLATTGGCNKPAIAILLASFFAATMLISVLFTYLPMG